MRDLIKKISAYLLWPFWKITFLKFGPRSIIYKPLRIRGQRNIKIGNNVAIHEYSWLEVVENKKSNVSELKIGEGTVIGHFNHIICSEKITIGKNVLTADKVYISDNSHEYQNVDMPIRLQKIVQLKNVVIGDGAWIGENVCIIGASVGKGSVIGANSVVTKSIPDYSIAVGTPAEIIKFYNKKTKIWEKV